MSEPEVALVFSPEAWVESLHRHLTDHGGARVRQVVMDPALALEEEYETLIVSHRWPALTRALVDAVHGRRRRVLGVFDRAEPAGRDYLLRLGADRVVESDAPVSAFLEVLVELMPPAGPADSLRAADLEALVGAPAAGAGDERGLIVAVGGPTGGGATEVAVELARAAGRRARGPVVVDADDVQPAVAQRLGLTIEPNLRTAVDAVEYGAGDVASTLVAGPGGDFDVLCGLPNPAAWSHVRPGEVIDVLDALARTRSAVFVDTCSRLEDLVVGIGRSRYGVTRAVIGAAVAVVGVGASTPVGLTRLLGWLVEVRALAPETPVHLIVNRAPSDAYRRGEIADELTRSFEPAGLWFAPDDRRVDAAAWSGRAVEPGPFTRTVADLAAELVRERRAPGGTRTRRVRRRLRAGAG